MSSTSTFGEHLKREREMRGVSLEEISAATRISVRFLEALENEHWAQLPGGIFNRGFIRSVARFLGMDEDGLVAEYALETRERPEIAVWTKEPVRKRPNWLAISATILVIALVIAGGWYGHRAYGPSFSAWHQKHPILSTVIAKFHRKKTATTASPTDAPPLAAQAPTASPQQPSSSGGSANQANEQSGGAAAPNPKSNDGAAPNKAQATGSAVVANSSGAMELKVEAGETSTVTVEADGKVVFSGKLEALKTLTLKAESRFVVSASKSNAVLLELNGRTVPPLGPPNEPGKITLTRESLNKPTGEEY